MKESRYLRISITIYALSQGKQYLGDGTNNPQEGPCSIHKEDRAREIEQSEKQRIALDGVSRVGGSQGLMFE